MAEFSYSSVFIYIFTAMAPYCCVSFIRRLMFPSKVSPSLNIPDLHPKVTYCFSEGSAVSHLAVTSPANADIADPADVFALIPPGPQWHDAVRLGELRLRAGKTFMQRRQERRSQAEQRAARQRQEDVRENPRHRLAPAAVLSMMSLSNWNSVQ